MGINASIETSLQPAELLPEARVETWTIDIKG